MYESPQQDQPIYEAKGIETVRRDGCPVVAKVSTVHFLYCYTFYYQTRIFIPLDVRKGITYII